jgi:hypothetical protein
MNVVELRSLASHCGVRHPEVMSGAGQLVRAIQKTRGQKPCFLSDTRFQCKDMECEWRSECIRLVAEWRR